MLGVVQEAARAARGWRHFRSIHEIPVFDRPQADWDTAYAPVLPGIHVFQIRSTDPKEMVNIHRSLLITFPAEPAVASRNPGARQAILCAQHGLHASTNLDYLAASSPPIEILAVMHGTREAILPWYLGGVANLGVHNGRALIEKLLPRPRYWIATHDGESIFHGLVGAVIKMRPMTFRDAISKKGKAAGEDEQETRAALQEELGVTCVALGNGESLTLE